MQMLLVESCLPEQQKVEKPEKRETAGESNGEGQQKAPGPAHFG